MFLSIILTLFALLSPTSAATWYFLRYYLPSTQSFLSFSGTMTIPRLPRAGIYYLWPGLQPTDNTGVYQNVLDGRSGTWWIGSGWCCSNPSLPWGSGFNVYQGDNVVFSNTKDASGRTWTSTLTKGSTTVRNSFALGGKTFNQAIFAIELTSVTWDFGALVWRDVVITSSGTDTKWCTNAPENYNGATNYALAGVSASVSGNVVTCRIGTVTLSPPK
ncbi:hypothetical protein CC80DRAFT_469354 [Byssothecium circinans]|uniref:Concanavalin A-like lectin/glucanase n=1 Tax=Byssothecium circinans TaxID=147558 RepID=A0A6A5U0I0_9PLEO|nr:hypothetical protein CC80DRAFT_469354 [Byssothecium circinans]